MARNKLLFKIVSENISLLVTIQQVFFYIPNIYPKLVVLLERDSMAEQDLHIHSTFSVHDGSVVEEQTIGFIAQTKHARIRGISDHFEHLYYSGFEAYMAAVKKHNLHLGVEVDGPHSAKEAIKYDFEYYIYHCYDTPENYAGAEILLTTGKPVIIAHPYAINTNLRKVPPACLIEINNRYIWRCNWRKELSPFKSKFKWVLGSDAHQPHWLNQTIAGYVAKELGIQETILF